MSNYNNCVFCDIANVDAKNQVLVNYEDLSVVVFEPLNPCIVGHRLFVPITHVKNITDLPHNMNVMNDIFEAIQRYTESNNIKDYNVIINNGELADQTVFHLHVHLIPRIEAKSVAMPWSHQWVIRESEFKTVSTLYEACYRKTEVGK